MTDCGIIRSIYIQPWGVLGKSNGGPYGELPDYNTVIVDPAGMPNIKYNGPRGAQHASRAIYEFLGIYGDNAFTAKVQLQIKKPLIASREEYSGHHVIHVVGTDYRGSYPDRSRVIEQLSTAYRNVFREFCKTEQPKLRLVPISGGSFAGTQGPMYQDPYTCTAEGIAMGFDRLDTEEKEYIRNCEVSLCIFEPSQVEPYTRAMRGEEYLVEDAPNTSTATDRDNT